MAVGNGVTDGIGVKEPTIARAVASTPMGVTDGSGVNESTKARTVASTSTGVAVGTGSSICGVTVGTGVSVGTGVNSATMAWTVARTLTGVGVTGGGCTHAVAASNVTTTEAAVSDIFMFEGRKDQDIRNCSVSNNRASGWPLKGRFDENRGITRIVESRKASDHAIGQ